MVAVRFERADSGLFRNYDLAISNVQNRIVRFSKNTERKPEFHSFLHALSAALPVFIFSSPLWKPTFSNFSNNSNNKSPPASYENVIFTFPGTSVRPKLFHPRTKKNFRHVHHMIKFCNFPTFRPREISTLCYGGGCTITSFGWQRTMTRCVVDSIRLPLTQL